MELVTQITRWFENGDEAALGDLVAFFETRLYAPSSVLRALGAPAIDDLRSDLIWRLLRADGGALFDKPYPLAYAKAAWRNTLAGELRKWGPRLQREPEVRRHLELTASSPRDPGCVIDAERALALAHQLTGKARLALLLTTRPAAISNEDWADLISSLPPPPPARPALPLDREDASLLLFPPTDDEDDVARRRRKNSFDRTYARAIERLRRLLLPEDS